jgi:ABC-type nitrate/sulfonate/bicarbonate transport system ATPase subunit
MIEINKQMKKEYSIGEPLVTMENINLSYKSKVILRNINLVIKNVIRPGVEQGQVVAMIGRSGVGKSQFFRVLSGLMPPKCCPDYNLTGKILIDIDQHPVTPGQVGIVPQNYILFKNRTVYQNLKRGVVHSPCKRSAEDQDALIRKYAEDFSLTDHLTKYPGELSGGQKQRVSIIQQVLTDNKFILLDEPFSGLDTIMVDKVIDLLNRIAVLNELNTLVIVSHDLESSMAIADTVWVLAKEPDKEGATITKQLDLMDMGMAWDPDIRKRADFQQLVHDVKHLI